MAEPVTARSTTSESHAALAGDRHLFSSRVRTAGLAYVATVPLVVAAVAWSARGEDAYLPAMLRVGQIVALPGTIAVFVVVARVRGGDRLLWRLWAAVALLSFAMSFVLYARVSDGVDPRIGGHLVPGVVTLALLLAANTLVVRARSGERAAWVDAIEVLLVTGALVAPLALFVGEELLTATSSWFTVSAGLWAVIAIHGAVIAVVVRSRLWPGHRTVANVGIAFGVTVAVNCVAQMILGLSDFTLPAGPFLATHALSVAVGGLFFVFATTRPPLGLERLPARRQVRRYSTVTTFVLASIPVIGLAAWVRRDVEWVPSAAVVVALVLLGLSSLRNLLAGRETIRLYRLVEESAEERGELLSEVMAHIDADRHRAAAGLHRQAASLHATMASFMAALDGSVAANDPRAVSYAAERLRADLGQRADRLQRLAEAMKPRSGEAGPRALHLAAPIRASLGALYGDGLGSDLLIEVEDGLELDWTTEAITLRIVQDAALHAWFRDNARVTAVQVSAGVGVVDVVVTCAGPWDPHPDGGIDTVGSVVRFIGGDVEVHSVGDGVVRLHASIPFGLAGPADRPGLRVVGET
ncbi:MAG: hypothetical protein ACXIVQ_07560 [Acidimicrobiales bacterium]